MGCCSLPQLEPAGNGEIGPAEESHDRPEIPNSVLVGEDRPHPECALVQFYDDHIQIRRVGESEPLSLPTDKKDDVLLEPLIPAGGRARISRFMDVVSDAGSNWEKTSKELEQLTGLVDQALSQPGNEEAHVWNLRASQ